MKTEICNPTWEAAMFIHSNAIIVNPENSVLVQNAQDEIVRCGALLDKARNTPYQPMETAPVDGSTILLLYYTRLYSRKDGCYIREGAKWEECRFVSREKETGRRPHWQPWCGKPTAWTTDFIAPEDTIGWMPLPSREAL